jgi:hypothetical protein
MLSLCASHLAVTVDTSMGNILRKLFLVNLYSNRHMHHNIRTPVIYQGVKHIPPVQKGLPSPDE